MRCLFFLALSFFLFSCSSSTERAQACSQGYWWLADCSSSGSSYSRSNSSSKARATSRTKNRNSHRELLLKVKKIRKDSIQNLREQQSEAREKSERYRWRR
ncbi:MAG: hypothetical protein ACI86H_001667 [bacterium]|jgi:hypothetical protein